MDKDEIKAIEKKVLASFKPNEVKILRITTTSFAYQFDRKLVADEASLIFNGNLFKSFGWKIESDEIFGLEINLKDEFLDAQDNSTDAFISGSFQFSFYIKNLQELLISPKGKEPLLAQHVLSILLAISFSTIRGIVADRTANTPFSSYFLPIINPNSFFEPLQVKQSKNE